MPEERRMERKYILAGNDGVECSLDQLVLSPQRSRHFINQETLKELAQNILQNGQLQPILVRILSTSSEKESARYEIIVGERRYLAIQNYTSLNYIFAHIIQATDLEVIRMITAENMQREDLSPIESIDNIVKLLDAELLSNPENQADYGIMGESSLQRVQGILAKLYSTETSIYRGSEIDAVSKALLDKFVQQVEEIFTSFPKVLKWKSFFRHDLQILQGNTSEVLQAGIQWKLKKSKVKALGKLHAASPKEFQALIDSTERAIALDTQGFEGEHQLQNLKQMSTTEIQEITEKVLAKSQVSKLAVQGLERPFSLEVQVWILHRLGFPQTQIVERLSADPVATQYFIENLLQEEVLSQKVKQKFAKNLVVKEVMEQEQVPEILAWSWFLEGKTDRERFQLLEWTLSPWDRWSWKKSDSRFGKQVSGKVGIGLEVLPQLVGAILFYFSRQGQLIFDPLVEDNVVPEVCLAMNRRCKAFDSLLSDPTEGLPERPEIKNHPWDFGQLAWPSLGREKPDLIFFHPPEFAAYATRPGEVPQTWEDYVQFLIDFLSLAYQESKVGTTLAFLTTDQRPPETAMSSSSSFLLHQATQFVQENNWQIEQILDCPLPVPKLTDQFREQLWESRLIRSLRRSLIIAQKK